MALRRDFLFVLRYTLMIGSYLVDRPQRLRRSAEEMRSIAQHLKLMERAQASILRIADEYDRLAARAEERLKPQPSGLHDHRGALCSQSMVDVPCDC